MKKTNENEKLLTIKEVSEYLKIPVKSIYNKKYRREIPFVKIGNLLRFKKFDIDNWLEEQKTHVKKSFLRIKM